MALFILTPGINVSVFEWVPGGPKVNDLSEMNAKAEEGESGRLLGRGAEGAGLPETARVWVSMENR